MFEKYLSGIKATINLMSGQSAQNTQNFLDHGQWLGVALSAALIINVGLSIWRHYSENDNPRSLVSMFIASVLFSGAVLFPAQYVGGIFTFTIGPVLAGILILVFVASMVSNIGDMFTGIGGGSNSKMLSNREYKDYKRYNKNGHQYVNAKEMYKYNNYKNTRH